MCAPLAASWLSLTTCPPAGLATQACQTACLAASPPPPPPFQPQSRYRLGLTGPPAQGSLGHYPAADHAPGSVREIWDWDGSFFIGTIPEVPHTFNVVGNTNEYGLTIGETTWGGVHLGKQTGAIMVRF